MLHKKTIAVIRDGFSDYLVIKKFLITLFNDNSEDELTDKNFIDLDSLRIFDPLSKYLEKVSKSEDYTFDSEPAKELVSSLLPIYFASINKLSRELEEITNREILIIHADAERLLMTNSKYFDNWAYSIKEIIQYSIEQFYDKLILRGYQYKNIPFLIPLIFFPSSEVLVASCMFDFKQHNIRELKPTPALKRKVYESASIPEAIKNNKLEVALNKFITPENVQKSYKELPEIRLLIHSLIN
jgi:hypothetical protein